MTKSIAVAGKGGTGKSTIAALLVSRLLQRNAGPILAVDADPDSNLGTLLGLVPEQSIGDLRDDVLKEIKDFPAGMSKANYVEAGLHQIISEADGFDMVTMGKGEGPGCYCYLNSLIKKFSDDLTPSYDWLVMDNEAGLEHISRRTSGNINTLLVIVTDNPLSIQSAKRVKEVAAAIGSRIENIYAVTNMLEGKKLERVRQRLGEIPLPVLCSMPYDEELNEAVFEGTPLQELRNSSALEHIDHILDTVGG
jgi:CO dehydrogenase maturation factor